MLGKTNITTLTESAIITEIADYGWIQQQLGVGGNFVKTIFKNDYLVGITAGGTIAYTTDGEVWNTSTLEYDGIKLNDIEWDGSRFLLAGSYQVDSEEKALILSTTNFSSYKLIDISEIISNAPMGNVFYEVLAIYHENGNYIIVTNYRYNGDPVIALLYRDLETSVSFIKCDSSSGYEYESDSFSSAKNSGRMIIYNNYEQQNPSIRAATKNAMTTVRTMLDLSYGVTIAAAVFECKDELYYLSLDSASSYGFYKVLDTNETLLMSTGINWMFTDGVYFDDCQLFINNHNMLIVKKGESIGDKTLDDLVEIAPEASMTLIEKAFGNLFIFGKQGLVLKSTNEVKNEETALVQYLSAKQALEDAKAYTDEKYEHTVDEIKTHEENTKGYMENAFSATPEGYAALVDTVNKHTIQIDTIIEKAELNIKNTASGEDILLTDSSSNKVVDFALLGKSEQNQYTGKNLLNNTAVTTTKRGITFKVYEDKRIHISGTCTEATDIIVGTFKPKIGETYIFTTECSAAYNTNYVCYIRYVNGETTWHNNGPYTFTATTEDEIECRIWINTGQAVDLVFFKPMIRLSTVKDATYEPYVGEMVSPNPDYPQEIGNVAVSKVKTCGKNLWPYGDISGTLASGVKSISLEPGTYTLSAVVTSSDTDTAKSLVVFSRKKSTNLYYFLERGTRKSFTFKTTVEITGINLYAGWNYALSRDDTFTYADIQIEKGDTATEYEAYQESAATLSEAITLHGIGDVRDAICRKDGVYGVLRRFATKTISSVNNVQSIDGTNVLCNNQSFTDRKVTANYLADRFTVLASQAVLSTEEGIVFNTSEANKHYLYIGIDKARLSPAEETVAAYKTAVNAWLASNPITVLYELEEPTSEALPEADQLALCELETFYPITNISNDAAGEMEVVYIADSKKYIDNKIAEQLISIVANIK